MSEKKDAIIWKGFSLHFLDEVSGLCFSLGVFLFVVSFWARFQGQVSAKLSSYVFQYKEAENRVSEKKDATISRRFPRLKQQHGIETKTKQTGRDSFLRDYLARAHPTKL